MYMQCYENIYLRTLLMCAFCPSNTTAMTILYFSYVVITLILSKSLGGLLTLQATIRTI